MIDNTIYSFKMTYIKYQPSLQVQHLHQVEHVNKGGSYEVLTMQRNYLFYMNIN